MYYEARTHTLTPVQDAREAARLIKTGKMESYQALHWTEKNQAIFCVSDGHIDNPFLEMAILRQHQDGTFEQIESITPGGIKEAELLAYYFQRAAERPHSHETTQLIIGQPKGHETAEFCCSCCGEYFIGNVKEQKTYDQDQGYGLCNDCK